MISSEQIRAARALLRLEQDELARRAKLSVTTMRRLETENGAKRVAPTTVERVKHVLEEAGAEFIEEGVRRRKQRNPEKVYRKLRAIAERSAAQQAKLPPFSESDLYDENGLPR